MASNSRTNTPSASAIEQLIAVTGVSDDVARQLLIMFQDDVQMAVNFYLEESEGLAGASSSSSQVRAPIPPQQEVLVEAEYYNNRTKRAVHSVFDSFRNFEVEARRQEELMNSATPKKKHLEDLFRPPLELIYQGTFQDARDAGVHRKKWLLVNVQNVLEFSCQVLNRDVWSNKAVRTIIKEHFIFWQVFCDSSEGQRYSAFYNVSDWPYVAAIDPRTGECLQVWNRIDASSFCASLLDFLYSHVYDEEDNDEPSSKRQKMSPRTGEEAPHVAVRRSEGGAFRMSDDASASNALFHDGSSVPEGSVPTEEPEAASGSVSGQKSILDANEDEQLAAAIQASLAERTVNGNDSSSQKRRPLDPIETTRLASGDDDKDSDISFMLRYPDGAREIVVMPSTAQIKTLTSYVADKGYAQETYELVTNFPRRVLSDMDEKTTLIDLKLHRQETVFIEMR